MKTFDIKVMKIFIHLVEAAKTYKYPELFIRQEKERRVQTP